MMIYKLDGIMRFYLLVKKPFVSIQCDAYVSVKFNTKWLRTALEITIKN